MNERPLLLCLSKNATLLELRSQVLSIRYDVVPIGSLDEMEALSSDRPFEVLVLCHTLSQTEFDAATELARSMWPGIQILAITTVLSARPGGAADVDSLAGPPALFRSISGLLAERTGSHL